MENQDKQNQQNQNDPNQKKQQQGQQDQSGNNSSRAVRTADWPEDPAVAIGTRTRTRAASRLNQLLTLA